MIFLFLFKDNKYPFEKSFFKIPKKLKLTKNSSIKQEEHIIDRKNKDIIEYAGPQWSETIFKPIEK